MWPEVYDIHLSTTSQHTITVLQHFFGHVRITFAVVFDNCPQFIYSDFAEFIKKNGVKHIRCAPYHPSLNGLTECFVRTFKQAMKAGEKSGIPSQKRLDNFLLGYRNTPQATIQHTPASLFHGRDFRIRLDLLKPKCEEQVTLQQEVETRNHDQHAKPRNLEIGEFIMAWNFGSGSKWLPGIIQQKQGPLSYVIEMETGTSWKHNVDHILPSGINPNIDVTDDDIEDFGELPSSGPDKAEPVVPVATPSDPSDETASLPAVSDQIDPSTIPIRQQCYPSQTYEPLDYYGRSVKPLGFS